MKYTIPTEEPILNCNRLMESNREFRRRNALQEMSCGLSLVGRQHDDAEAERRKKAVEKRKAKDKIRKRIGDKARKRNRK